MILSLNSTKLPYVEDLDDVLLVGCFELDELEKFDLDELAKLDLDETKLDDKDLEGLEDENCEFH